EDRDLVGAISVVRQQHEDASSHATGAPIFQPPETEPPEVVAVKQYHVVAARLRPAMSEVCLLDQGTFRLQSPTQSPHERPVHEKQAADRPTFIPTEDKLIGAPSIRIPLVHLAWLPGPWLWSLLICGGKVPNLPMPSDKLGTLPPQTGSLSVTQHED